MADDWIKMRTNLQTHPKIVRIASALDADTRPHGRPDKFRAVGALHAVWSVFDAHSVDGELEGYTPDVLDAVVGLPGISQAMIGVGWLVFDGSETLALPDFDDHNGASSKRRGMEAKRKRRGRKPAETPATVPTKSGQTSASDADKKRTREEKRREEDKTPCSPPKFEEFWSAYPKKVGKQAALARWKKINPSAELTAEILRAVASQKSWPNWIRDNGQYIPNPATWINEGRWEDERPRISSPSIADKDFAKGASNIDAFLVEQGVQ